ncbi:hypothetical protein N9E30_01500 [Flavobacteriales bacterium]|nr:hypothetical protein [Flavobacteriales bacterium]MDB3927034.1 hypothetical protein [Flavobacteriales bacterium]
MKFERVRGKCNNCEDSKIIIKEKNTDKVRFFYENEWRSVLLLCRRCNAKVRDTFQQVKDDK